VPFAFAEPAAIGSDNSSTCWLTSTVWIARPKQCADGSADITFKPGARRGKVLAIEKLVIPLCRGEVLYPTSRRGGVRSRSNFKSPLKPSAMPASRQQCLPPKI
jgi:hypothetical protein